uniref:TPM_phosphatase domain-containing protein n=1 Tax=Loa loa TaxID=7209 RepID=A0A1I7VTW6_LOALO
MGSSSIGILQLVLLLLILSSSYCLEWDVSNFPNPTAGDYKRCRMRTTSNICDPDEVLTDSQRYRLNHELHQLESRTRQDHASDFCQKKGITAAMAIVKHIQGNSDAAVKEMANQILRKWSLDKQCQKSVVFVVATEDHRFWVARDARVPVYAQEFTQIFNSQKQLFQQGDFPQALGNIIQETWQKALSKQGGAIIPSDDKGDIDDTGGFGPSAPSPTRGFIPRPDDGKKRGSLLPHIPFWFWIILIVIISTKTRAIDIESGGRGPIDEGRAGQLLGGGGKRRDVPASPRLSGWWCLS